MAQSGTTDLGANFGGAGVTSIDGLTGALTLIAGTGITITDGAGTITIAANAASIGITSINADLTTAQTLTTGTTGTDFAIVNNGTGDHKFNLPTASAVNRGALSSADWTTFNSKQATGNYITALTGDGTATGPGSVAFTLATVNGNVGSFGTATQVGTFTVNAKGLITAASNTSIQIAESQVTNLVSDLAGKQATGNYITALTGDVTATGPGSVVATIANLAVTNAKIANATIDLTTKVTGVLPIANGGTNNSSAYTNGSIIFSNGTSLTQDNANFFWNDTNQSIGIGTNTPAAATFIDAINTTGATKRQVLTGYGTASIVGYRMRLARGTIGTPAAVQTGDILGFFNAQGYGTSQFPAASTGAMTIYADETFTNTSNATRIGFNTTPTGAVTTTEVMRINSNGSIALGVTSSTAIHQINGGLNRTTRTITANLTVDTTTTDDIILCNAAGAINVTLPTPTTGRVLTIKDISGAATANNITIVRHAAENIEGLASSYVINTSFQTVILTSDGTNWWIVG